MIQEQKWTAENYDKNRWAVFCGDTTIADCFSNPDSEANARLIAAATEMSNFVKIVYELLTEDDDSGERTMAWHMTADVARQILDRIDGIGNDHEQNDTPK